MSLVTILRDETHNKKLMQIDINALSQNQELLEDIIDLKSIEMRKDEDVIAWDEAKKNLFDDVQDSN